jgi:hypothetical protein
MADNTNPHAGDVFESCARFFRNLALVLYRCRMSLLGAALAAIFIAWPDQSIELFRIYLEDLAVDWAQLRPDPLDWAIFTASAAALPVAAIAASISLWYWGRFSLYVFLPQVFDLNRDQTSPSLRFFARVAPRLCGLAIPVALAIAFIRTQYRDYWIAAALCGVVALLFLIWWTMRRARLDRQSRYRLPTPRTARGFARLRDFGGLTWAMMLLSLAIAGIGIWAFGFADILFAQMVGAAPLVLFWVALVVPIASMLAWAGKTTRVPVLSLLLLAAFGFGLLGWSSNNQIRFADLPGPNARAAAAPSEALSLQESIDQWLAARRDRDDYGGAPYPVVFVAAQGGGIRAAYLTARVLAAVQDRCPRLAHHMFAISGVSGGSLGASTFAALVANAQRGGRLDPTLAAPCEFRPAGVAPGWFQQQTESVLRRDFLAPPVARLITSDLLGAFIPYRQLGWAVEDRGHALERAFESAWRRAMGDTGVSDDLFSQRFGALWSDRGFAAGSVPALFLNATNVETGTQTVVSPFDLCVAPFHGLWSLHAINPWPIPLSVATGLSARFPFVTSSGSVPVINANRDADSLCAPASLNLSPGDRDARMVDGGYYENSGTSTLVPVILGAQFRWPHNPVRPPAQNSRNIFPIVLRIENAEARTAAPVALVRGRTQSSAAREPATSLGRFSDAWWEVVMDPIRAVMHARETHGYMESARLALLQRALDPENPDGAMAVITIRIDRDSQREPIPLGWALSQNARCELDRLGAAQNPRCPAASPDAENIAELNRLVALLRPRPPRPSQ